MKILLLVVLLSKIIFSNGNDNTGEAYSSPVLVYDLPEWFYEGGCIGISDPYTDTVTAYRQAVSRALALYVLNQNMELSSVYEYYYLNDNLNLGCDNYKSHWIADFETESGGISYEVEKKCRTRYGETIVRIRVVDDAASDMKINVSGSLMYHYDYVNGKSEYGEKQMISIASNEEAIGSIDWLSTVDNARMQKVSYTGGSPNKLRHFNSAYGDHGDIGDDMLFVENKYGLWDCFADTFLQAMSNFESENIMLKNSTRDITQEKNEDYGNKSQNIVRSVTKTEISCSLKSVSVKNNTVYVNWEIVEK